MSNKRYPEEFKFEAVKQVTERGHSAPDVTKRLGAICAVPVWCAGTRRTVYCDSARRGKNGEIPSLALCGGYMPELLGPAGPPSPAPGVACQEFHGSHPLVFSEPKLK